MEQTQSSKLVYSKELTPLVEGMRAAKLGLECMAIDALDELLQAQAESFPFSLMFDQAVRQPIVVLHSSGSTGLPKPVVMTHGTFATLDNDRNLPNVPGRKNHDLTVWDFDGTEGRIYEPFPPFHLAGFMNKVMVPLYTHTIPVFGPPLRPPSGALAAEIMQQQDIDGSILPPAVAEQLLHEPNGLDYFKKLKVLCYAGGPLSQAVGDEISKVTMVCQFYGSTELGQVRQLVPQREDWSYMEFHPDSKLEFQPAEDDAFELVVFADASTDKTAALNHNYPGTTEWRTKDLFRPHPTKPNLWRFHGRRDDIIVLSNGEKFNPVPMESMLQGHPCVAGAVVTGQGRFQPALLIEPKPDHKEYGQSLAEKIWPLVEKANLKLPGHGRVIRPMIMISKPDKPFPRAGKGTVIRKLTEAAYAAEIDALYTSKPRRPFACPIVLEASTFRPETVSSFIRSTLAQSMPEVELEDEDNFYSFGFDSLKTTEAAENLKASLLNHRRASKLSWLSADTFYKYPSIEKLSAVILAFLNDGVIPGERDRVAEMSALFEAFASSLPTAGQGPAPAPRVDGAAIALTGSTGLLGKHLLESLLNNSAVSRIYCLNRSGTARQRWEELSERRGIDNPSIGPKMTFLTVDFGRPRLGLEDEDFTKLTDDCDLIVHAAWKVDFNQSLSSFTDNIRGVQTLVQWSALSSRRPRVVFVSSISSVGLWGLIHQDGSSVPEAPVADFNAALGIGYAESKLVAEHILDRAATQLQIPVSILRVGQISGSTRLGDAAWAESEWIPSMLRTSRSIGLIPADLPPVDWIPINKVSEIVLDLSLHDLGDRGSSPKYYNLVNPHPVPWSEVLGPVQAYCGPDAKLVPLSEWVQKLQALDRTDAAELEAKPALKIIDFFASMVLRGPVTKYQTVASVQASKSMGALKPVTQAWMQTWLKQGI